MHDWDQSREASSLEPLRKGSIYSPIMKGGYRDHRHEWRLSLMFKGQPYRHKTNSKYEYDRKALKGHDPFNPSMEQTYY